jgi:hypothetical protein
MSLALTERQAREIEMFCEIARENGAAISLRELIGLAGIAADEHDLENAFLADSQLRSRFLLESGYVLERFADSERLAQPMVEEEEARRARARENLKRANKFGMSLLSGTLLVSVSGANSYLSARENEDIDFFCVTKTDGMWPFILKALLLARIHRLANRDVPELCFSCVMDEEWATQAFVARQPPIFARDALTAKVIGRSSALHALLEKASWMETYFPVFYGMRLRETSREGRGTSDYAAGRKGGSIVVNSFLYHVLGSFLRMKSWARNRKLTKAAWHSSIFETRVGKGHYIYESKRYRRLRRMYGDLVEGTSDRTAKEVHRQSAAGVDTKEEATQKLGPDTVEVVTTGRATGRPHVAIVRFVLSDGAFLVMGGGRKSDWFLNALSSKSALVRHGDSSQAVRCEEFPDSDLVRRLFAKRYGVKTVEEWYSAPEIRSLKLTPTTPSAVP